MKRAPLSTCLQLLIISLIDSKYTPAVIGPGLLSRKPTFIKQCSIRNSCGKFSTPTYLNVIIYLTKLPLFCKKESKSNKFQKLGSLNKVQLIDVSGTYKDCTLCDAPPYLASAC